MSNFFASFDTDDQSNFNKSNRTFYVYFSYSYRINLQSYSHFDYMLVTEDLSTSIDVSLRVIELNLQEKVLND